MLKIYTKSTGIWRHVDGPVAADISKDNNALLFSVKQEDSTSCPRKLKSSVRMLLKHYIS
jgi:hypothetical protein